MRVDRLLKKLFPATVLCLIFVLELSSRTTNPPDNSLDFKALFKEAEAYMDKRSYPDAIEAYNRLLELDRGNSNIYYKLGRCHLESGIQTELAVFYLKRAVKRTTKSYSANSVAEDNVPETAYFYLGRAYHLINKFDKAIANYEKCALILPRNHELQPEIARHVGMCSFGKIQIINKLNVQIKNVASGINTEYNEYGPIISGDESVLIFSSQRKEATGNGNDKGNRYNEDIYISYAEGNSWTTPAPIGESINTSMSEVASSISPDGQELFLHMDVDGKSNLFHSYFLGDVWSKPEQLQGSVNSESRDSQAAISSDGQLLFFVSDRPGGYGGSDIYRCKRLPNGDWAIPTNLGSQINTRFEEVTPFLHPNGDILFFSSDGHQTIGGLDILFSEIDAEERFGPPVNVGYPINSSADDSYYSLSAEGKKAHFTSVTNTGLGASDIFAAEFFDFDEIAITVLRGVISTEKQPDLASKIEIYVFDNADTLKTPDLYRPNSTTGRYIIMLSPGKDYRIQYEIDGFIRHTEHIFVPKESAYQEIEKSIDLQPIELENKD